MSSKLGWHFQAVPSWAPTIVNSSWVKIIDPPAINPFPAQKVAGRIYIPDGESWDMIMRNEAGAQEWFNRCRPGYERSPWVWAWEGPNEPPVGTPEQRAALVRFTRRWTELMNMYGYRTIAYNLSVGWPDVRQAGELSGGLEFVTYLGLHEYGAPSMQSNETWYCLRYRRTVEELKAAGSRIPPILITECGIDGGVVNRPKTGWKTFVSRSAYMSQLAWYDGELRKDDYVEAAVIFTSGANWDWMNFDIDEPFSRDLAAYIDNQRQGCGPADLRTVLLEEAEKRRVLRLNPTAALQKYFLANGWCPVSNEFDVTCDGKDYIAQGAEHLVTGVMRVFYAEKGHLNSIKSVIR